MHIANVPQTCYELPRVISGHGSGPKQPAFCKTKPKEHYASAQKNESMNKSNSNSACVTNISA